MNTEVTRPQTKKRKSFKVTILQAFITILVVTVGLLSGIFYLGSKNAIILLTDRITREVSEKVILTTTHYLNGPANQTVTTSHLVTDPNIMKIHEQLWRYMWEQLLIYQQIQSLFIANAAGSYVQVRREPRLATRFIDRSSDNPLEKIIYRNETYGITEVTENIPNFDPRVRTWYKNTGTSLRIYWTDVYVSTTARTPVISASYPVIGKNGEQTGVVCTNIPLHSLSEFLLEQRVSANGVVFITNEKHEVIAYPGINSTITKDESTNTSRLIFVDEMNKEYITRAYKKHGETGKERFDLTVDNAHYIVNVIPFPKSFSSEWNIFVVIPESDILGAVNQMLIIALSIGLGILLLSILIIFIITNNIGHSIINLAESTETIRDFRLDEFIGVKSKIREINLMSDALIKTTEGLKAFGKYVPSELVRQLIQMNENAKLGGVKKEVTIFFTDIQSFTSISQDMDPEGVMNHLSDYLDNLCTIIMNKKGTIDKFIGDGIMAFWGAPVVLPDSPERACEAALECQKKLAELNPIWERMGKPPLPTRIGIHTGDTVVGNVGSRKRMNYTIVGDSVNLASRLEGTNKTYGTYVIISEDTYAHVSDKFLVRPLDIVAVKGRTKSVGIYELVASFKDDIPEEKKLFCAYFKNGFEHYLKQEWKKAFSVFKALAAKYPEDKSLILYMNRCRKFVAHPESVPENWDGTYVMKTK